MKVSGRNYIKYSTHKILKKKVGHVQLDGSVVLNMHDCCRSLSPSAMSGDL